MPFDASGLFQRLYSWVTDRDNNIKILASRMDAEFDNVAGAIDAITAGDRPFRSPIKSAYGTAAAPGVSFNGDGNTGMYRPGADQVAFSAGGTQRLLLTSSGATFTGAILSPTLTTPTVNSPTITAPTITAPTFTGAGTVSGTFTFSTAPLLANAILLSGKTAGGVTKGLIGINASGHAQIGDASVPARIVGSDVQFNGSVMWHASNDGAGSGLDADLLDGLESTRFARADATVDFTATQVLANNIFLRGRDTSASPINLIGMTSGDSVRVGALTSPLKLYGADLTFNDGTETTIWHSGNDGAGSGLDADLLDGQQGSYYTTGTNISAATESARGTIEIASSAEATAGTDNTRAMTPLKVAQVVPALLGIPAWANFGWTGSAVDVRQEKGVASITRSGGGVYDVVFDSPMSNSGYAVLATALVAVEGWGCGITNKTTTGFRITVKSPGYGASDSTEVSFAVFGA